MILHVLFQGNNIRPDIERILNGNIHRRRLHGADMLIDSSFFQWQAGEIIPLLLGKAPLRHKPNARITSAVTFPADAFQILVQDFTLPVALIAEIDSLRLRQVEAAGSDGHYICLRNFYDVHSFWFLLFMRLPFLFSALSQPRHHPSRSWPIAVLPRRPLVLPGGRPFYHCSRPTAGRGVSPGCYG